VTGICLFLYHGQESTCNLLIHVTPPLSVEALAWQILPTKFSARALRPFTPHITDRHFDGLCEQVYKITELLSRDGQIAVTDTEQN
jgi:hypothetical protein